MHSQPKPQSRKSLKGAFALFGMTFALGFSPVAFNVVVDPYQVISSKDRTTAINDLAEKSHYPLWKLAKYKRGSHDTIILGDSRARSLRDKYWHEAGLTKALNLAYGGGTIPEIYSTFKAIKNDGNIRRLIIGIQLRSFDEDHKGGMNRVPEAVKLLSNRFNYLKNWHVTKTSADIFKVENADAIDQVMRATQQFSMKANASELGKSGETPLKKLLEPKICFGCDLPEGLRSVPYIRTGAWTGQGRGHQYFRYYTDESLTNASLPEFYLSDWNAFSGSNSATLPKKFDRQVRKNGTADWRSFQESERYWSYLETIASWAKNRNVEVVFVVPPTIVEMQETIVKNGLAANSHQMRLRLSTLGKVLDLDFPNSLTADLGNFTDAYHFNSKVARAIVGEVITSLDEKFIVKKRKTAFDLKCNRKDGRKTNLKVTGNIHLTQGMNCRIWEAQS